jgi:hypothetical protein
MNAQESSYDDNALRVESHLGDFQIVRGSPGTVVAKAGVFRGPKVMHLVGPSERALAEAKVFERDFNPGQYILAVGIATFGAAIGASRIPDINNAIPAGLTGAGIVLIAYGGSKLESAYVALSRAIWWYNRDLKR